MKDIFNRCQRLSFGNILLVLVPYCWGIVACLGVASDGFADEVENPADSSSDVISSSLSDADCSSKPARFAPSRNNVAAVAQTFCSYRFGQQRVDKEAGKGSYS